MHQISVLGETDEILKAIDTKDIEFNSTDEKVTFYSENYKQIEIIKEKLCSAIADIIYKKYSTSLIASYYNSDEYSFSQMEKDMISSEFYAEEKKGSEIIKFDVESFLKDSSSISVEGFVKFRLSGFKKYIKSILDQYESVLEAVREYDDLIELLKAYVETLDHTVSTLHINVMNCGGYILYDTNYNDITESCIKAVSQNNTIGNTSFDDLLLSCVITASPEKIVIHNEKNVKIPELFMVLKRVFSGKVYSCEGCKLCNL